MPSVGWCWLVLVGWLVLVVHGCVFIGRLSVLSIIFGVSVDHYDGDDGGDDGVFIGCVSVFIVVSVFHQLSSCLYML